MSYTANYTIPLTTSAGNRVVGVYLDPNVPEKTHEHEKGVLFHCPSPIKIYSMDVLIFSSNQKKEKLIATNLPKTELRYSLEAKEYKAVFIEIRAKSDTNTFGLTWEESPKEIKFEQGCWTIKIHKTSKLLMGDKEGFAVSQVALKIYQHFNGKLKEVKPLPQLPHFTYYLHPQHRYQFEANNPTDTFILETPC
jgi:hypothetical protein